MSEAAATGAFVYLANKGDEMSLADLYEFLEMYEPELLDRPIAQIGTTLAELYQKYAIRLLALSGENPILGAWNE